MYNELIDFLEEEIDQAIGDVAEDIVRVLDKEEEQLTGQLAGDGEGYGEADDKNPEDNIEAGNQGVIPDGSEVDPGKFINPWRTLVYNSWK